MFHPNQIRTGEALSLIVPSRSGACLVAGCPCKDARIVSIRRAAFFAAVARRTGRPPTASIASESSWRLPVVEGADHGPPAQPRDRGRPPRQRRVLVGVTVLAIVLAKILVDAGLPGVRPGDGASSRTSSRCCRSSAASRWSTSSPRSGCCAIASLGGRPRRRTAARRRRHRRHRARPVVVGPIPSASTATARSSADGFGIVGLFTPSISRSSWRPLDPGLDAAPLGREPRHDRADDRGGAAAPLRPPPWHPRVRRHRHHAGRARRARGRRRSSSRRRRSARLALSWLMPLTVAFGIAHLVAAYGLSGGGPGAQRLPGTSRRSVSAWRSTA